MVNLGMTVKLHNWISHPKGRQPKGRQPKGRQPKGSTKGWSTKGWSTKGVNQRGVNQGWSVVVIWLSRGIIGKSEKIFCMRTLNRQSFSCLRTPACQRFSCLVNQRSSTKGKGGKSLYLTNTLTSEKLNNYKLPLKHAKSMETFCPWLPLLDYL